MIKELIQRLRRLHRNRDVSRHWLASEIARQKRQHILRNWRVAGLSKKDRLGHERAAAEKARRLVRRLTNTRRLSFEENLIRLRHRRDILLLDSLFPERTEAGGWRDPRQRSLTASEAVIDLEDFSFLHNPRGVLEGLRRIASAEAESHAGRINFRDPHCLDVAPFMLLAECWSGMLPIFHGGHMEVPVQKVLAHVGLQKALRIGLQGLTEFSGVWAFPLQRRRPTGSSQSATLLSDIQKREIVADEFCDALDEWLMRPEIERRLNENGRALVKNIFGELLENAERHSDGTRRDGDWAFSGFMARRWDEALQQHVYRAHVGFVSLGDTFSESLARASDDVQRGLKSYTEEMRRKGCSLSAETLHTLAALQDGVTSVPEADKEGRGGFGLQDMLEFISQLGHTDKTAYRPRVTIVSGESCIMLREPYICGAQVDGDRSERLLWCNESNSRHEPPDESFVFDLGLRVPGTVISVGFALDPDYFNGYESADGESDD